MSSFGMRCCVTRADDGPERWAVARELLDADPSIGRANIYAASASADHRAVEELLTADPSLANRQGGPLGWDPLLYLTYARYAPEVPLADVLTTAGCSPSSGADPNAGFLWNGLPTPVHGAHRRLRVGRAGRQQPTTPSARPHAGPAAARGRRRPQRRPGPVQPDVRGGRLSPGAPLRLRSRIGRRRTRGIVALPEVTLSPEQLVREPTQLGGQSRHGRPHPAAGRA